MGCEQQVSALASLKGYDFISCGDIMRVVYTHIPIVSCRMLLRTALRAGLGVELPNEAQDDPQAPLGNLWSKLMMMTMRMMKMRRKTTMRRMRMMSRVSLCVCVR